jgi:hypothetical protein
MWVIRLILLFSTEAKRFSRLFYILAMTEQPFKVANCLLEVEHYLVFVVTGITPAFCLQFLCIRKWPPLATLAGTANAVITTLETLIRQKHIHFHSPSDRTLEVGSHGGTTLVFAMQVKPCIHLDGLWCS